MKTKMALVFTCSVHLGSLALMVLRIEPFYSLQVPIAIWTLVIIVASINQLRSSNSVVFQNVWSFFQMAALSTLFWLLFELFNFRLMNWQYIGLPLERLIRWPVYIFAFSGILPSILEISTFLANLGIADRIKSARKIKVTRGLLIRLIIFGILAISAAMVSPRFFYPLIWLGPIFILDPIVYTYGKKQDSLIGNLSTGNPGLWIRLSITGLVFGILCQFWSFWAGGKWLYTVPGYDWLPLFELPLLGYLAFPFLAFSLYSLYRVTEILFRSGFLRHRYRRIVLGIAIFIYVEGVIWGIDEYTVLTYRILFPD